MCPERSASGPGSPTPGHRKPTSTAKRVLYHLVLLLHIFEKMVMPVPPSRTGNLTLVANTNVTINHIFARFWLTRVTTVAWLMFGPWV